MKDYLTREKFPSLQISLNSLTYWRWKLQWNTCTYVIKMNSPTDRDKIDHLPGIPRDLFLFSRQGASDSGVEVNGTSLLRTSCRPALYTHHPWSESKRLKICPVLITLHHIIMEEERESSCSEPSSLPTRAALIQHLAGLQQGMDKI